MLAAIDSYVNKHSGVTYRLVPLHQMQYATEQYKTPLPELLRWVSDHILPTEGIFALAQARYAEFKKLQAALYEGAPRFFAQNQPATR